MSNNTNTESNQSKLTYLAEGGIPLTDARKLANKLEQAIEVLNETYATYKFYGAVEVGSGERHTLSTGVSEEEMLSIPQMVENIALTSALKTYLEDAIKAYDRLKDNLKSYSFKDYCNEQGIDVQSQEHCPYFTEDDYYGSLSVEETCRLLTLEARAATIGSLIHPKGRLNSESQKVLDCLNNPFTVSGSGKDTIITETSVGMDIEEIDKMFFHLQALHRDTQKKINTYKFNCQQAIDEKKAEADACNEKISKEQNERYREAHQQYVKYVRQEESRLSRLGVVIPQMLLAVYKRWA